jgi:hypothetical protein
VRVISHPGEKKKEDFIPVKYAMDGIKAEIPLPGNLGHPRLSIN